MIEWSVDPEIFSVGPFSIRWYGLGFALSFLLGFYIFRKILLTEKKPEKYLDELFIYMFIGTIAGARLGHCLFYDPGYYLSHPLEIVMIWHGGLASHGAAIGILAAMYFFAKGKKDINYWWVLDRIVIVVALAGFFIRMGNLFNSEIYGKPTEVPWAFVFTRVDDIPRHPTQIYEAVAYLLVFLLLYYLYQRKSGKIRSGFLFGMFLVCVFTFRIFVEFFKAIQSPWEADLPINMGQLLSIPFVLLGIIILSRVQSSGKRA